MDSWDDVDLHRPFSFGILLIFYLFWAFQNLGIFEEKVIDDGAFVAFCGIVVVCGIYYYIFVVLGPVARRVDKFIHCIGF